MTHYDVVPYLDAIRTHLAGHDLPAPTAVDVLTYGTPASIQLASARLSELAADLLAWAATLEQVGLTLHRFAAGGGVRLAVTGRVATGLALEVWGAVDYHPATFPDLPAGVHQSAPLFVLHQWAKGVAA